MRTTDNIIDILYETTKESYILTTEKFCVYVEK